MPILRNELGDVLRDARLGQGKTLRDISSGARVSLGYLSEVERGQKEASSELLASISLALDVPMSAILREVSVRFEMAEGLITEPHARDDSFPGYRSRTAAVDQAVVARAFVGVPPGCSRSLWRCLRSHSLQATRAHQSRFAHGKRGA